MEITSHSFWTLVHGMGFGALYLLAGSGALIELHHRFQPASAGSTKVDHRFLGWYLAAMALLAWLTVLAGTYIFIPGTVPLRQSVRILRRIPAPICSLPFNKRVALHRYGVEGACRMAGSHSHHDGRGCGNPPSSPTGTLCVITRNTARSHRFIAFGCGYCRFLRCDARQSCAC